ncbi:hypothetical protein PsYK624_027440 [Phanerochaete sordida]|uniref:Uncharacterized protein n=1 Tax=Phanerochaete sordida TaxID=48140 RepID=A0A9P3G1Q8_9APHY|nr:hypothetical protein PsYK624_027440 [Phanerochaete sordida]
MDFSRAQTRKKYRAQATALADSEGASRATSFHCARSRHPIGQGSLAGAAGTRHGAHTAQLHATGDRLLP